ncbi:MAG: hypothetical protein V4734_01525, partial [Terriglobus sp.]
MRTFPQKSPINFTFPQNAVFRAKLGELLSHLCMNVCYSCGGPHLGTHGDCSGVKAASRPR